MSQPQPQHNEVSPSLVIQALSRKLSQINYENALLEGRVQMLQAELAQLHEIMKSLAPQAEESSPVEE